MTQWRTYKKIRRWFIAECTRLLTTPLAVYEQRVPNNMDKLKRTLRIGDVLLVEGDQRISQVIRYLTQSSWSHCALYVGDALLKGDPERVATLRQRFGDDANYLLIEADVPGGVCATPLAKYERFNIRICRPRLHPGDTETLLEHVVSHLGRKYNVRHVFELARFFFPVSIVPRRWRRAALTFGAGNERSIICSKLIADAFTRIRYPILPEVVTVTDAPAPRRHWVKRVIGTSAPPPPLARFRCRSTGLVTPRDFDLSPYFEVVKFNHVGDPRLNYRDIVWDDEPASVVATNGNGTHGPAQPIAATPSTNGARGLRPAISGAWSALAGSVRRIPE